MGNEFARSLRIRSTDAESLLWSKLRAHQLGPQFRRQAPIGRYVVDFVCFKKRLVIEVDGGEHKIKARYDASRTRWLESQGFRVIRFANREVLDDIERVVANVVGHLETLRPPPRPSPTRGEGEGAP